MADLIDREEVLTAWKKMLSEIEEDNWLFVGIINPKMVEWAIKGIENLPSAEKRGKWTEREVADNSDGKVIEEWQSARCSVCGRYHTTPYMYFFHHDNYCPNCGAAMESEE